MTWHYQVRCNYNHVDTFFEIVEVYTDPYGVTENAITPMGESKDELIEEVRNLEVEISKLEEEDYMEERKIVEISRFIDETKEELFYCN